MTNEEKVIEFVWDSGSPIHIISDLTLLYDFEKRSTTVSGLGGGTEISPGFGKMDVSTIYGKSITLDEVYYLPNSTNIISGKRSLPWTYDQDIQMLFDRKLRVLSSRIPDKPHHIYVALKCKMRQAFGTYQVNLRGYDWLSKLDYNAKDLAIHLMLGHPSYQQYNKIRDLHNNSDPPPKDPLPTIALDIRKYCRSCRIRTMTKSQAPRKGKGIGRANVTQPLQIIHVDLAGPIEPKGHNGEEYFVVAVDRYSGMIYVEAIIHKRYARKGLLQIMQRMQIDFPAHKVLEIRADNGSEFQSLRDETGETDIIVRDNIPIHTTVPYSSHQNGRAERAIRTLVERTGILFDDSGLLLEFWPDAIRVATLYLNNLPRPNLKWKAPNLFATGHHYQPVIDLPQFGCLGEYMLAKSPARSSKFDEKAQSCVYLGPLTTRGALRCLPLIPTSEGLQFGPIVESHDTSFKPSTKPFINQLIEHHCDPARTLIHIQNRPYEYPSRYQPSSANKKQPPELTKVDDPHLEPYLKLKEAELNKEQRAQEAAKRNKVLRETIENEYQEQSQLSVPATLFERLNNVLRKSSTTVSDQINELQGAKFLAPIPHGDSEEDEGQPPLKKQTLQAASGPERDSSQLSFSAAGRSHEVAPQSSLPSPAEVAPSTLHEHQDKATALRRSTRSQAVKDPGYYRILLANPMPESKGGDIQSTEVSTHAYGNSARSLDRSTYDVHPCYSSARSLDQSTCDDAIDIPVLCMTPSSVYVLTVHVLSEGIEESENYDFRHLLPEEQEDTVELRYKDGILQPVRKPAPETFREAVNRPTEEGWKEAIERELNSFEEHNTFEICNLPKGMEVMDSKWLFLNKSTGLAKARLVVRGFNQLFGRDYSDTYAPVANYHSVKIGLAIAAAYKMSIIQVDVKTAFLNGQIDKELYLQIPEGMRTSENKDKVLKINGSVYGLKQAPKLWNERIDQILKQKLGFKANEKEPCFYHKRQQYFYTIIVLYVDDMLIMGTSESEIIKTKDMLSEEVEITFQTDVKRFLGMTMDIREDKINVSLKDYISESFNEIKPNEKVKTPCSTAWKDHLLPTPEDKPIEDPGKYRLLVGKLLFASTTVRYDIAFAVAVLSRYMAKPTKRQYAACVRVVQYLKGTEDFCLTYHKQTETNDINLEFFTDADWGGCPSDSKSISGFIARINDSPIYWRARG